MSKKLYDVIIVGTGPAGMFTALKLVELAPHLKIAMFEKGKIRSAREATDTRAALDAGQKVNVTEGWGGAGAFSDGKFNLDTTGRVGGRLVTGGFVTGPEWNRLLKVADETYVHFGGDADRLFGTNGDENAAKLEWVKNTAFQNAMDLHTFPIRHLGTSNAHRIVENIRAHLLEAGVEIISECKVERAEPDGKIWRLITERGEFSTKRVVMCPGRSGARWFQQWAMSAGLPLENNGVDIGVRVETRQHVMESLTRLLYEAKIYYLGNNKAELRTFCMCPRGRVAVEAYRDTGIFCANGHTDPERPSENCNFAILHTQKFTEPFDDPLGYALDIAGTHTRLSKSSRGTEPGGVLVQRLGDMKQGQRSDRARILRGRVRPTCLESDGAIPGNIMKAMPADTWLQIMGFLKALDNIVPGINSGDTLLYAPEIKFNAVLCIANPQRGFEAVPGLHVAGDGTGYTRGLNGASVHGMLVAEWIAENM